ncbi:MAG: MFS transporter [Pseudomonadota bacterium]|nr:MFS transporter [Pseudomonadota bacterium]
METGRAGYGSTLALASLSLAMLLSTLGISVANIALPALATAFGAAFQDVQWVVLTYLLAITTLIVGAGRLGDRYGRRRILAAGLVLHMAGALLAGLAPSLDWLVAARVVQGTGAAAMMALSVAMVGQAVPKAHTGRAMGLLGTMSAIGTASGPSLGGLLIAEAGWRSIFLVNLPLGLVALVLVLRVLPRERAGEAATGGGFDIAGTVVLALSLGAYALSMTLGRGDFGAMNLALLAGAAAGLGVFAAVERRAASPLVRLSLFRDRGLRAGLVTSALVSTVMMATLVVGPFHLSAGLGLDMALVGLAVSVGPVVAALAGVPAGRLTDRFGSRRMSITGLVGVTAGCAAIALLPSSLGLPGYVLPLVAVTAGYALFQTANNTAVMAGVAAERRGLVSGLLNLSRNLGLVTGASAMGAVFAVAVGGGGIEQAAAAEIVDGTHLTFAVAAALAGLALLVALGGWRRWRG